MDLLCSVVWVLLFSCESGFFNRYIFFLFGVFNFVSSVISVDFFVFDVLIIVIFFFVWIERFICLRIVKCFWLVEINLDSDCVEMMDVCMIWLFFFLFVVFFFVVVSSKMLLVFGDSLSVGYEMFIE